jgi:hypothetical protein
MKQLFIDVGVYGITQKFRIIKTSKKGENRPLIPLTYINDLQQHFITNINNQEDCIYINYDDKKDDYIKIINNIDVKYAFIING